MFLEKGAVYVKLLSSWLQGISTVLRIVPVVLDVPRRADCGLMQVRVAQKVATGVYKGVTTSELDELAAETAASMTATHPDYAIVSPAHQLGLGTIRQAGSSLIMSLMQAFPSKGLSTRCRAPLSAG